MYGSFKFTKVNLSNYDRTEDWTECFIFTYKCNKTNHNIITGRLISNNYPFLTVDIHKCNIVIFKCVVYKLKNYSTGFGENVRYCF